MIRMPILAFKHFNAADAILTTIYVTIGEEDAPNGGQRQQTNYGRPRGVKLYAANAFKLAARQR